MRTTRCSRAPRLLAVCAALSALGCGLSADETLLPAEARPDEEGVAGLVRARVRQVATGALPGDTAFPLPAADTDAVRTLAGLRANVLVQWMDPLTSDNDPDAPRLGCNPDYVAYLGDGWDAEEGSAPAWNGSGSRGWMWVSHESISGTMPGLGQAPTGQHLILAERLWALGALSQDPASVAWSQGDLDAYIARAKRELGGSFFRVTEDPSTGAWAVDRSAAAVRYDATSGTRARVAGQGISADRDDTTGLALPDGVASGTLGNCAGGVTPWGTILSGEENTYRYYGDVESAWDKDQVLRPGRGFDPGAVVHPELSPDADSYFGRASGQRHARDLYGYVVEFDPGRPADEHDGKTTPGVGHKKLGPMGRARWESATLAVDARYRLIDGEPVVLYGADDRYGGRIYKLVTRGRYAAGMARADVRALLEDGALYAAHLAGLDNTTGVTLLATGLSPTEDAPGHGRWIELSVDSVEEAPNAAALGPGTTVGAALQDVSWNDIGGFLGSDPARRDDLVRLALFTASAKVGILELNRPEDMEWNPRDPSGTPRLYVAFTKHLARTALDQEGRLLPASAKGPVRYDPLGSIFALEEADPQHPGASRSFRYFQVWRGSLGEGDDDAVNPDNLVVDPAGGLWFCTDGNWTTNHRAEAVYYLDLDPTHKAGQPGIAVATFGKAFRVASMPADAEATGPAFSSDGRALFLSVQHPGDAAPSAWPSGGDAMPGVVAITRAPAP